MGDDEQAAIAETLMRDLPFDGTARVLNRHLLLTGRTLTKVRTTRELPIIRLRGADLSQVGQDTWLTKCDPSDYEMTREWAAWIRHAVPDAAGFEFRCRHDEDRIAWVLFEDHSDVPHPRARGGLVASTDHLDLDSPEGARLVQAVAIRHNATLDPPAV